MAGVFDKTSELLETLTAMSRMQCRGTIRLILNAAQADANNVSRERMIEILSAALPEELSKRGFAESGAIAQTLIGQLRTVPISDTAYDVFAKI